MSHGTLLSLYEKLAALLEKLPGGIQQPILRELEPIKELYLLQRPARIALVGDPAVELPAFLNTLVGSVLIRQLPPRGRWLAAGPHGDLLVADWRTCDPALVPPGDVPDLFLYVAVDGGPADGSAVRQAGALLRSFPGGEGGGPGLVVVFSGVPTGQVPEAHRLLADLAGEGLSDRLLFSQVLAGSEDLAEFRERLCEYLRPEVRLGLARLLKARRAQAEIAGTILKSFSAMAGVIGMQPIPLADFPVLLALQTFLVALVIHVSGRTFSPALAAEFAAALGVNFGAGLAFRETARGAAKLLPVWGHVISGGVAAAGTYALGRAAIAYFIEGASRRVLRGTMRRGGWRMPWSKRPALPPAGDGPSALG